MLTNKWMRPAVFYSPDSGGSGGDGNPPAGGNTPPPEPSKTFTQDQVNEIIKDRLARADETASTKILEALGVKSVDELKTSLTEFQKIQAEKLTEKEKQDKLLKDAQDKATAAESEKQKAIQEASEKVLKSEVKLMAAKLGFREESVDDVFGLVDKTKITEKDGKYVGVEEAVKAVATLRPFWLDDKKKPFGTPPPKPQHKGDQRPNNDTKPDRPKLTL